MNFAAISAGNEWGTEPRTPSAALTSTRYGMKVMKRSPLGFEPPTLWVWQ
jgi:hypothetical protein